MDAEYLRAQAERCYRLARECYDLTIARKLNEMGNEFQAKARKPQLIDQEGLAARRHRRSA